MYGGPVAMVRPHEAQLLCGLCSPGVAGISVTHLFIMLQFCGVALRGAFFRPRMCGRAGGIGSGRTFNGLDAEQGLLLASSSSQWIRASFSLICSAVKGFLTYPAAPRLTASSTLFWLLSGRDQQKRNRFPFRCSSDFAQ